MIDPTLPPRWISIIEDDAKTALAWETLINQQPGFQTARIHPDAADALQNWSTHPVAIALVDLHLPGSPDGADCLRLLKQHHPHLRCLIVTMSSDSGNLFRGLAAGADGYLTKDAPPAALLAALEDVLADRAPMSPGVARKVLQYFHPPTAGSEPPRADLTPLTGRELEVLRWVAKGSTNKEIALALGISASTVRLHLCSVYRKLHVSTRTAAAGAYLAANRPPPVGPR
jgi:DNA-binding NarL/FixJ family response regulator